MIYLDYNATAPLCAAAREAMEPYLQKHFGNPSSVHCAGREARAAIDNARDQLAALLGARPNELIFTSGGTEANNLALLGLARQNAPNGKHLISNRAEHHAVLNTLEHLEEKEGFEVTWLDVSSDGLVDPVQLSAAIRPDTTLVSIMTANNETGVLQPIKEIAARCRERGVLLHSDMVQSFGKISAPPDIPPEGRAPARPVCDAASFAAHKFYGPKGAGFLYLRAGLPIEAIQFGGAHEGQRRPGTENVAAIAGMAAAAQFMSENPPNESGLRDRLWRRDRGDFSASRSERRAPRRVSATRSTSAFPAFLSETLLMALDLEGICASSGSACMVGSVVASHVFLAMGLPWSEPASAIRFSLGKENYQQRNRSRRSTRIRSHPRTATRSPAAARPQHALV